MADEDEKVYLYVYDISQGMAKAMSMAFIGKQLDGIWHTGLVAYGYEYYYGGGIQASRPGETVYGTPLQKILIGSTSLPQDLFHEFLQSISSRYTPEAYSLLKHNCNHFTGEACKFLTGSDIPGFISGLPEEALNTPMGQAFKPFIEQMEQQMKQSIQQNGWQEDVTTGLSLPPINKKSKKSSDTKIAPPSTITSSSPLSSSSSSSSSTSTQIPTTPSTSSIQIPTTTTTTSSPIPTTSVDEKDAHPHHRLKLAIIGKNARPLPHPDNKAKSYLALVKLGIRKSPSSLINLDTFAILQRAFDSDKGALGDTSFRESLIDLITRLLTNWDPTHLYGLLGLFAPLILEPSFLAWSQKDSNRVSTVVNPLLALASGASLGPEAKSLSVPARTRAGALRALSNLLTTELGPSLAKNVRILKAGGGAIQDTKNSQVRSMGALLLFNSSFVIPKNDDNDDALEVIRLLTEATVSETDIEVCLQILLALGQLCYGNSGYALLVPASGFDPNLIRKRFFSLSLMTSPILDQMAKAITDVQFITNEEE